MALNAFLQGDAKINTEGLAEGLWQLGYDVDHDEVDALVRQLDVDRSGHLDSAEVAASIIDWHALQVRSGKWSMQVFSGVWCSGL